MTDRALSAVPAEALLSLRFFWLPIKSEAVVDEQRREERKIFITALILAADFITFHLLFVCLPRGEVASVVLQMIGGEKCQQNALTIPHFKKCPAFVNQKNE